MNLNRRWSWLTATVLWVVVLPAAMAQPTVILLSWDGLRHDFPDRGDFPTLQRMASQGVRALGLVPVFPSNTFPGHVSLATGTHPDVHGIVDNHFVDVEKGVYRYAADANWLMAEPLWIAAERQGVPTATYFWVGSETDWRDQGTRYRIAPFESGRPEKEKADQIISWLKLPEADRPRLIMSYWAGADTVAHRYGPNDEAVAEQLSNQDQQLGRVVAYIDGEDRWSETTLIVVSDHGMAVSGDYVDLVGTLDDSGIAASSIGYAPAALTLQDKQQVQQAVAIIDAITGVRAYASDQLPTELRAYYPGRSGDLVAIAEPPIELALPGGAEGWLKRMMRMFGADFGGHGYLPTNPDMAGSFLALGRGADNSARLANKQIHQIDVAATVAALLGIEPPAQSEGTAQLIVP